MTPPRFTEDDVGKFYADEKGDLWQLIAYASSPTATLERVTGQDAQVERDPRRDRIDAVVGAPLFDGFRKLVPEEPA